MSKRTNQIVIAALIAAALSVPAVAFGLSGRGGDHSVSVLATETAPPAAATGPDPTPTTDTASTDATAAAPAGAPAPASSETAIGPAAGSPGTAATPGTPGAPAAVGTATAAAATPGAASSTGATPGSPSSAAPAAAASDPTPSSPAPSNPTPSNPVPSDPTPSNPTPSDPTPPQPPTTPAPPPPATSADPPPPPVPATRCAQIVQFSSTSGYRPNAHKMIGAVWTSAIVKNCGTETETFDVEVIETVAGHPELTWSFVPFGAIDPGRTWGWGNLDNDSAKTSTTYHVSLVIRDHDDRSILAQRSADVTTPDANFSN